MCINHPSALSRRQALGSGLGLMSAAFLGGVALPTSAWAQEPAPNAVSPDEALKRLMEGNARYVSNTPTNKDFSAGRAARAKAQYPFAGLVSCADSRVAPELAFDEGPGELFVVRVAGNFVNVDGLASLEYGVKFLGVPLIMVLGHTNCGAVDATLKVVKENISLPGHLDDLVDNIRPAVEIALKDKPQDPLNAAILENVRYNVKKLGEATPIISEFVANGRLKIVGGLYDLASGKVSLV
ncbi:carbonic anhydrase [Ancylobacter dichloromethanicus]|uniref:carbonic anhydrase n=1 Tax=Ancylobacter dichloromethanicus TaxID=518825 RepID=A0A9W6N101_9HYPH|nr:carbonic anhydrase [Ancylobacter dichloromethanicus]MBS7555205.1 carbonic anhydrase [Ancylobacter dichloromethanicus]GLK73706.1 carbonic anhydrase [Ancylobacter dichloromethanicus]